MVDHRLLSFACPIGANLFQIVSEHAEGDFPAVRRLDDSTQSADAVDVTGLTSDLHRIAIKATEAIFHSPSFTGERQALEERLRERGIRCKCSQPSGVAGGGDSVRVRESAAIGNDESLCQGADGALDGVSQCCGAVTP